MMCVPKIINVHYRIDGSQELRANLAAPLPQGSSLIVSNHAPDCHRPAQYLTPPGCVRLVPLWDPPRPQALPVQSRVRAVAEQGQAAHELELE